MSKNKEKYPEFIDHKSKLIEKLILVDINTAKWDGVTYNWKSPSNKNDPYCGWIKSKDND